MNSKNYWSNFYSKQKNPFEPSLFATFVFENYLKSGDNLIELGCGNGRDAFFFAKNSINVLAIDQCCDEVQYLSNLSEFINLNFKCDDFTTLPLKDNYNVIYSRFTLHTVTKTEEKKVLTWAFDSLDSLGYFCIEARGLKNSIYKKGLPVKNQTNAYVYENHYRRFIDINELCCDLKKLGFKIILAEENVGFAPFNNFDDVFIRIIAQKTTIHS